MHRVADAAVGADIGSDYGLGRQLKEAGAGFMAGPKIRVLKVGNGCTLLEAASNPTPQALHLTQVRIALATAAPSHHSDTTRKIWTPPSLIQC